MTIDYPLIGARIRTARKEKALTQEALAEVLGVSVGYVSQVERGVTKISLDLLGSLSGILGKDLSYFVSQAGTANQGYLQSELSKEAEGLSDRDKRILRELIRLLSKE